MSHTGRYVSIDYSGWAKVSFLTGIALLLAGAAGEFAIAETQQLAPAWVHSLLVDADYHCTRAKSYRPRIPSCGMDGSTEEVTSTVADEVNESGMGPAAIAAIGSVGLALYYYYVRGEKQRGQFVGLWPGTILGLATYLKLEDIKQMLQEAED